MELDRRSFFGVMIGALMHQRGWNDVSELPQPPEGFHWTRVATLGSQVICPNGWKMSEESHGDQPGGISQTVTFSKGALRADGVPDTKFCVNVVRNMAIGDEDIVGMCKMFVVTCLEGITPLQHWQEDDGVLYSLGIEKIDPAQPNRPERRIRVVGIANRQTNTHYLVQFEGPVEGWDEDWKYGEQIYDMFRINRSI